MNRDPLDDPQLQALEAQLASMAPAAPAERQRQLLYECAYAAGRNAAGKTLRRWQAAATTFAVLAIGLGVPLARDGALLAERQPAPRAPIEQPPTFVPEELPFPQFARRETAAIELDAWQTPPSPAAFDEELARLKRTDAHTRSLALGALTRTLLEQ